MVGHVHGHADTIRLWLAEYLTYRHHSTPIGQFQIACRVVLGRTTADLRRRSVKRETPNGRLSDFDSTRFTRVPESARQQEVAQYIECSLALCAFENDGYPDDDDTSIVHRRIEERSRVDETVEQRNGDTNLTLGAHQAAGNGAMHEDGITIQRIRHGDHDGCASRVDDSDVCDEAFGEDRAYDLALATPTFRMTADVSHDVPRLRDH